MSLLYDLLFPKRNIFDKPTLLELVLHRPLQYIIAVLFRFFNRLHSSPVVLDPLARIVCISDTHTNTCSIPDGDILIHAGDLTNHGTIDEIQAQIDWLDSLPHPHKIAIAGNHDTWLDPKSRATLSKEDQNGTLDWKSIHYLQHSSVSIKFLNGEDGGVRTLRIYGAPQIPSCGGSNFAFQYPRDLDAWTDTIPSGIDVLITHTPAKYHLDLFSPSLGCDYLLKEVWRIKPRLHIFGHIHSAAGREQIRWDEAQRIYERAMGRRGRIGLLRQSFSIRLWIDLTTMVVHGAAGVVWNRIWGGEQKSITLVNAALMYQNTGSLGNPVQIVDI
jgi:hypothetical protein